MNSQDRTQAARAVVEMRGGARIGSRSVVKARQALKRCRDDVNFERTLREVETQLGLYLD